MSRIDFLFLASIIMVVFALIDFTKFMINKLRSKYTRLF